METLVRSKYEVEPEEVAVLDQQLANEAEQVLGYSAMREQAANRRVCAKGLREVQAAFTKLGIEPFSAASVARYKVEMLRKANRPVDREQWFDGTRGLGVGSVILAAVGTLLSGGFFYASNARYPWLLAIALPCTCYVAAAIKFGHEDNPIYEWHTRPISSSIWPEVVPSFALARAIAIKRELPNAAIEVESLVAGRVYKDPFLVVDVYGERFYVDVWDEPTFEGRRQL